MDLQSLFPVYLQKSRTDDQSKEDYDTQITQNENVLNQNLNILFNGIRDLADAVEHIEVAAILDKAAAAPTHDDISDAELRIMMKLTPVGIIIEWQPVAGDPTDLSTAEKVAAYYGFGTWEQVTDRFLLAAGSSYAAGSTGGAATHTLTINEMPSHNHVPKGGWGAGSLGSGYFRVDGNSPANKWTATESTGGGAAHNNMPPYLAVYMWKRTA